MFPPEGGDSVVLPLASVDAASEGVLAQVVPGDHGRAAASHLPGRLSAGLAVPATGAPTTIDCALGVSILTSTVVGISIVVIQRYIDY